METCKVNGVPVEVIECFKEHILVQEVVSRDIYLVFYWQIDPSETIGYNSNDSNIISLKGWLQWQEEKEQLEKLRNRPKKRKKKAQPLANLRLIQSS